MGIQLPIKGAQPPNFRAMSVVPKRLNGSRSHFWYGGRPCPMPHSVRWGWPALPLKKGHSTPSFQYVCCGQTAEDATCTEVSLGPGHNVLDGDPKGGITLIFGRCLLWPNGWMDQDATWYGCRPRPRPHSVRWRPSSPKMGDSPQFSANVCLIVAKRLDSRCHLIRNYRPRRRPWGPGSCPTKRGTAAPSFGPCLLWPNGRPSQQLLSSCN